MGALSKGAERAGREATEVPEDENLETYTQKTFVKGHHKRASEESIVPEPSEGYERDERRAAPQFYVEVGQGSYKSEQVTYPPDYLKNQLMKLLHLKEKRERNKKIQAELTASSVIGNSSEIVTEEGEGAAGTETTEAVIVE